MQRNYAIFNGKSANNLRVFSRRMAALKFQG